MKYITLKSKDDYSMVYCNLNGKETAEDIIKATLNYFIGKFNANEHMSCGCNKILNDENVFIMENNDSGYELWQVGSKVSDMTGAIIPHLYYVRHIGYMFK